MNGVVYYYLRLLIMKHEKQAKLNKVKGQIGYAMMWFFLAGLIETLMYLGKIEMFIYHIVALALSAVGCFKVFKGFENYKHYKNEGK